MNKTTKIWDSITTGWGMPFFLAFIFALAGYLPYFTFTKISENDSNSELADITKVTEVLNTLNELKNICYPDPDCFSGIAKRLIEKEGTTENFKLSVSKESNDFLATATLTSEREKLCKDRIWASKIYFAAQNRSLNETASTTITKADEVVRSLSLKTATGRQYNDMYEALCADGKPNFEEFIISQSFRF